MSDEERTSWGPVWAMSLGVAGLSTAELLPVALLTPIAADLNVSTGVAGQAISATGAVALVSALTVAAAARRVDRRTLLLAITVLHTLSTLGIALAPSFWWLLGARVLLGFAVGSFWGLSSSLAMRLAHGHDVPKAIGIILGGSSLAAVAAAPIGSFLGGIIGWRAVFLLTLVFGVTALVAQYVTLPAIPSTSTARLSTLVTLLRRREVTLGLLAIFLTFGGTRMLYTYIRPLVDRVAHGDVVVVSLLLLVFGVARFAGSTQSPHLHRRNLPATVAGASLLVAVMAVVVVVWGTYAAPVVVVLVVWGVCDGTIPVGWSTWVTRAVADQPETGGGLQVALIQSAIVTGAAVGGLLVDRSGIPGVAIGAAVLMLAGAIHVALFVRLPPVVRITLA